MNLCDLPDLIILKIVKYCDLPTCLTVVSNVNKHLRHLVLTYGPKLPLTLEITNDGFYTLSQEGGRILSLEECCLCCLPFENFETKMLFNMPDYCSITRVSIVGPDDSFEYLDKIRTLFSEWRRCFCVNDLAFHDENLMDNIHFPTLKQLTKLIATPNVTEIGLSMDIGQHMKAFLSLVKEMGLYLTHWHTFAEDKEDVKNIEDALLDDCNLKIRNCKLKIRIRGGVDSKEELSRIGRSFAKHLGKVRNLAFTNVDFTAWNWSGMTTTHDAFVPEFHPIPGSPYRGYTGCLSKYCHRSYELQRVHKFPSVRMDLGTNEVTIQITARRRTFVHVSYRRKSKEICIYLQKNDEMFFTAQDDGLVIAYLECDEKEAATLKNAWFQDEPYPAPAVHCCTCDDENLPFSVNILE